MKTPLTEEQRYKLLEALRGHPLEAIITLALVTGMRRDELLNLKWRDIDLEKGELQVLSTKTKSSYQPNPLPEQVTELLKQHRLRQIEMQAVAGPDWFDRDLVFSNQAGGFLGTTQLLQGWHEALEQAGLPSLRFHDLRVAVWRALSEQIRAAQEQQEDTQIEESDLDKNSDPS